MTTILNTGEAAVYTCQRCNGLRSRWTHTINNPSNEGLEIDGKRLCICAEPIIPDDRNGGVEGQIDKRMSYSRMP